MKGVVEKKIKNLEKILNKYDKLNEKTNNKYLYRVWAIETEIRVLEEVLRGETNIDEWLAVYEEDKKEIKI